MEDLNVSKILEIIYIFVSDIVIENWFFILVIFYASMT